MMRIPLAAAVFLFLTPAVPSSYDRLQPLQPIQQEDADSAPPVTSPVDGSSYKPYPQTYELEPALPSPFRSADGREYVVVVTGDERFAIVPVTVENAVEKPGQTARYRKGRQLDVDGEDFPALAATGLHSEKELLDAKTITGKPVAQITEDGRPGRFSAAGFMAEDEDIISVLAGDNRIVKKLGLKHPELARPLFYVWNYILVEIDLSHTAQRWQPCKYLLYGGKKVSLKCGGSKGFQESIFNDEIRGTWQIWLQRELSEAESTFLQAKYPALDPEKMEQMVEALTSFHTGEMVPYYIMRYGFYEGHTDYRADPIAIAFIFGLRSLEEIEAAFEGKLHEALLEHFSQSKP